MDLSEELLRTKALLEEKERQLNDREREYLESAEELIAQKEELTSAIEELVSKNSALMDTLTKLQKRNEELDQVLYRASHDFRTPVASLKGLLELLSRDLMTEAQRSIYQHMNAKVQQMERMLESLQELSDAAFRKLSFTTFPSIEVYESALSEVKAHRCFEKVHLEFQSQNSTICTDRGLLHIILASLLSNALSYRKETDDGQISVHITAGDVLRVLVGDNGDAIPGDIASRMFDMFYRGTEKSSGAGLGLYIVRTAAERLGGSVGYKRVDGWNQFVIDIPEPDSPGSRNF